MKCDFTSQLHPYTPLIRQIPHFLLEDWIIYFEHILRADNECVNRFVKIGISSNDALKIWNSCPLNLSRDGRCCIVTTGLRNFVRLWELGSHTLHRGRKWGLWKKGILKKGNAGRVIVATFHEAFTFLHILITF
ncbi:hypothetical protein MTR_3g078780 [Medicago truncatula]|uniref:Uncharacterized protein n=1 Tax=Medicago truncatula TaxID=3880 RepID=G8A2A0_MEDTR|nr:hypothetical protein MTR_3g078780 [Medicago truncatula]